MVEGATAGVLNMHKLKCISIQDLSENVCVCRGGGRRLSTLACTWKHVCVKKVHLCERNLQPAHPSLLVSYTFAKMHTYVCVLSIDDIDDDTSGEEILKLTQLVSG